MSTQAPNEAIPFIADQDFQTRNEALKLIALQAGIRLPKTRIPEGESLLPVGEENKRALQAQVADLPTLKAALGVLSDRIAQEKRIDTTIPLQRLRMDPSNGGLFMPGSDNLTLGYTPNGLGQFVSAIKPSSVRAGAKDVLLSVSPKVRAEVVNEWVNASTEADPQVIRTLVNPESGRRYLRAVTSQKHSLETGDDSALISVLGAKVPEGAKLRITRTPDRSDFELIWPAMERQLVVGDVALIALSITNSETKAGALKIEPKLLRVLCYNFTTAWSDGAEEEISIRHVGDLKTKLPQAFARALKIIDPFVRAFGDAYRVALPESAPTRGEILAKVAKVYELPESTMIAAGRLWDADGAKSAGDTLAGLVNALTRASQEDTMEGAAVTERAAGKLVMQGWGALAN